MAADRWRRRSGPGRWTRPPRCRAGPARAARSYSPNATSTVASAKTACNRTPCAPSRAAASSASARRGSSPSEIAPPHAAAGEHDERPCLDAGITGCTRDIERFGRGFLRLVAARVRQQPARQRAEHDRPHQMAGRCDARRRVEVIDSAGAAQPGEHRRALPEQPGGPHQVALGPGQRRRGQGHPAFESSPASAAAATAASRTAGRSHPIKRAASGTRAHSSSTRSSMSSRSA